MGIVVEEVALDDGDAVEALCEHARCEQSGDAAADDDCLIVSRRCHATILVIGMGKVSDTSAPRFDPERTSSTDDFGYWREVVTQTFVDLRLERDRRDTGFFGSLSRAQIGELGISQIRSVDQHVYRDRGEIARTPKPLYFINLQLAGTSMVRQAGEAQLLEPGDFALVDATRAFELGLPGPFHHASFKIPHELLRPRLVDPDAAVGRIIRRTSELGSLVSDYLRATAGAQSIGDLAVASKLSDHVVGLVALTFGAAVEAAHAAREDVRAAKLRAAKAYIDLHLAEPLTPARVARALHVSPRFLHLIFEPSGESMMRYVMRRRLERCRDDLADRAHADRSIADIAFAWGFSDLSHFGRAFRAAFGTTPRDHRRRP
jgi:AraC-like DNA-binding protein